jgi:hypothetical protein
MFTKSFRRGELRIQATKNLLEQELSLLPDTLSRMNAEAAQVKYYMLYNELSTKISEFMQNPFQDTSYLFQEILRIQDAMKMTGHTRTDNKKARVVQRKSVKCPGECTGFIFSSGPGAGTCGLCATKVCLECNCTIKDSHTCNPDDIASFSLIKQSCVQCPKCATQIQKISGCNQMWCTSSDCNTAFDWQTGRIINGPIHNPHYHQWLAQGNVIAQEPQNCDGRNSFSSARIGFIYDAYELTNHVNEKDYLLVKQYIRSFPESFDIFRRPVYYDPMTYDGLRRRYLKGQMTKAKWASNLSHCETIHRKNQKLYQVYSMFQNACTDIFNQLYNDTAEASSKPNCGTRSIRNRYNIVRIVKMVHPQDSQIIFQKFLKCADALRIYLIKEICKILDDYSDTLVTVLDFDENKSLTWSKKQKSKLIETYLNDDVVIIG